MNDLMEDFDVLFPDEREKGETTLRQCQLVMLRMLKILDYLCTKHSIKYFLTGGTLLGSIRHNGFIPWDDDIDVGMTRDNYEKFVKLAVPELPGDIFFQNQDTDPYYNKTSNVDARLRDKYSSYIDNNVVKKFHQGLMLDIFVYDRAFFGHNFFVVAVNRFSKIVFKNNNSRAKLVKAISRLPLPFVYSSNFLQAFGGMHKGTYVKTSEISNLLRQKFEDAEVLIPEKYDPYLRRQYGDYMQLPPVKKRISTHNHVTPDAFTPCNHPLSLNWKERKNILLPK
jgi:lipopolysaccharide cholinephosphotransferase